VAIGPVTGARSKKTRAPEEAPKALNV